MALVLGAALPAAVAAPAEGAPRPAKPAAAVAPVAPVDINTATVEGLTGIPSIGKVTAQAIVEWRQQNGPFRQVDDLLKVKGIGEKSLEKIRPYVKVSRPE
jgi:competence protein ComEA